MGQYYRIANLDKRETLDPFKFGSALKLTESCYVGNDYVDAITYLLANDWHGDRVLLCGDYAWDEEVGFSAAGRLRELAESDPFEAAGEFLDRSGDFASVRGNEVYREVAPNRYGKVPVDGTFHIDAGHYRYVADETAGVFYDREKAPVAFIGEWEGEPYITRTDPLTLFMAIGNGLGSGDYHGEDAVNVGLVGSWAGHVITASDVPPVGLTEIECPFDENGALLTAPDDEIRRAVEVNGLDWNHVSVADLAKAVERMIGQTGQTVPTVTLTEAVISWPDSPDSTERVLFCDQDGVDLDPDLDANVFRFGFERDELDSMIGVETGEGFIVREVGDSYDVVAHTQDSSGLDLDAEARDMRDTASSLSVESPGLGRDAIDR